MLGRGWLSHVAPMQVGRRARVNHTCGPGRTLLVSRDAQGYRAWCFRCNEGSTEKDDTETLTQRLARMAAQRNEERAVTGTLALPTPGVADVGEWPLKARVWLHKAGLGRAEIGQLGAYYHPGTDRVVLPVLGPSGPVFWQARALDGQQPKYLAPVCDRSRVIPVYGSAPDVTLTEDILSAFKVGMVGEGWAMLGTRASDHVVARLLARRCRVNVWLDNDPGPRNRGQEGAAKIVRKLRSVGLEVRNIVSDVDPKMVHRGRIRDILEMKEQP